RGCGRLRQLDRASPHWLAGMAPRGVARDRPWCRSRRAGAVPASGQHRTARHRPRAEDHHPLMPERPAPAPPLRFLFFGAGAVGSLLGARLAQAGCEVTLIGRPSHVEAVARDGVRMVVAGKVSNQSVLAARPSIAEAGGPFDYVFLTVKGYDTLDAIDQLQLALRPGTILGSFQNGVGNEETIALALPEQALVAGSLTVPVFLEAVTVMNRMRLSVVALPGLPAPSLRRAMNLPPLLAQMLLEPRLGGARGNKMPSLWWDLSRAKGKTEAAFLNGAVVDAGRRYDVPTPVNSVLWAIVEKSTKLPSEWERYRRQPDRLKALLRTAIRL